MENQGLHRVWAGLSLVLFLAMAAAHLLALSGLFIVPTVATVPLFFLLIVGQLIVILAFPLGGRVRDRWAQSAWMMKNHWSAFREGIRVVPRGWLVLALFVWFLYLPAMFFGHLVVYAGEGLDDRVSTVLISLFFGTFALIHFLMLRYVIPRKEEIRARVEERARE